MVEGFKIDNNLEDDYNIFDFNPVVLSFEDNKKEEDKDNSDDIVKIEK